MLVFCIPPSIRIHTTYGKKTEAHFPLLVIIWARHAANSTELTFKVILSEIKISKIMCLKSALDELIAPESPITVHNTDWGILLPGLSNSSLGHNTFRSIQTSASWRHSKDIFYNLKRIHPRFNTFHHTSCSWSKSLSMTQLCRRLIKHHDMTNHGGVEVQLHYHTDMHIRQPLSESSIFRKIPTQIVLNFVWNDKEIPSLLSIFTSWIRTNFSSDDFRLPPRCWWNVWFSG
jgi:hypothetical protein